MSLAGVIDVRGTTCRVRRASQTAAATGTTRAWADAPRARVKLLLEEVTAERAQRAWGLTTEATVRATMKAGQDVRKLDGLVVESGKFTGARYVVVEDPRGADLGPQLVILGLRLASANEKFGL